MEKQHLIVSENSNNYRLDKLLSTTNSQHSRAYIQKSIKNGLVSVNNKIINDPAYLVKSNDLINYQLPIIDNSPINLVATKIDFEVVYEDMDIIVINKPPGLTVHPGAGNINETLVNGLLFYTSNLSSLGGEYRPGIVHRLDKDTSGLMIVAKNNVAHNSLAKQLSEHSLVRKYKTLIWGILKPSKGIINLALTRNPVDRKKIAVAKNQGRQAITHYYTDKVFLNGKLSLVTCRLETGRTHQIRVHLSHVGHSVVGDQTYGSNLKKIAILPKEIQDNFKQFKRQALHSYYLMFSHPTTNELMEFEIDLPTDMQSLLKVIKNL